MTSSAITTRRPRWPRPHARARRPDGPAAPRGRPRRSAAATARTSRSGSSTWTWQRVGLGVAASSSRLVLLGLLAVMPTRSKLSHPSGLAGSISRSQAMASAAPELAIGQAAVSRSVICSPIVGTVLAAARSAIWIFGCSSRTRRTGTPSRRTGGRCGRSSVRRPRPRRDLHHGPAGPSIGLSWHQPGASMAMASSHSSASAQKSPASGAGHSASLTQCSGIRPALRARTRTSCTFGLGRLGVAVEPARG